MPATFFTCEVEQCCPPPPSVIIVELLEQNALARWIHAKHFQLLDKSPCSFFRLLIFKIEGVHGTLCGVVERASGEDADNCRRESGR